jgi:hypothetical protein
MLGLAICMTCSASAAEKQTSEHSIVGLFSPDREQDLRNVMADISEFELVHLDYENARATFRYDVRELFPEMNPKKIPTPPEVEQRLSKLLSSASEGTFTLKPLPALPKEKLTRLELQVGILDCKGCRYAAYLAVTKVGGVEQATVGADNIVTAWIDPTKADRAAVEEALKKARIEHVTGNASDVKGK